jgi:hypothetical protein
MGVRNKAEWAAEMNGVAAIVHQAIRGGMRLGLSREAAALGAQIGVLSFMRVDGVNEDDVIREAKKAVPVGPPGRVTQV